MSQPTKIVYLSGHCDGRVKYHTDEDCPHLPDDVREFEKSTLKNGWDICDRCENGHNNNHGGLEGTCPQCGERYENTLPKHLRNDCESVSQRVVE